MAKLPSLTARKVVRALKRAGFVEDRQKGSHLALPEVPLVLVGRPQMPSFSGSD
jgi:predicted RNA binding protein YcfA (HicA-like mRNA interferase family)